MQIFVKNMTGRTIILDVLPSYTIRKIKELLKKYDPNPPEIQKLLFKGKYLEDDDKTLADYNIQKESTIYLKINLRGTFCYIVDDEGLRWKIDGFCDCCSNTLYLKEQIEEQLGIDVKYQELIVDGKIMQDSESLRSYGVSGGKEVKLNINISPEELEQLNNDE